MMISKRSWLAAALVPCLALLPCTRAWASGPDDDPEFAAPPPTASDHASGHALRLTDLPEPPPPAIELPDIEPDPAPETHAVELAAPSGPQAVDGKRPIPGRGLIVLGGFTLATSVMMSLTALGGPGWLDMDQDDARIIGLAALPLAASSIGMIVGGTKAAQRYDQWAERNHLDPPESGNGMLVAGSLMMLGCISTAAYGGHLAQQRVGRQPGEWIPTITSGFGAALGLALLSGGMLRRSKFVRWDRAGYVTPGPLALRRGVGLSISGRF